MGNSASQQRPARPDAPLNDSPVLRGRSPSPAPGHPHRSMRSKKKSLELPDFNRTTSFSTPADPDPEKPRQKSPPKSQAINIPKPATDIPPPKRPNNNFSSTDLIVPSTHLPFPPTQPGQRNDSTYAGHGGGGHRSKHGRPQRMAQMYEAEPPPHQQELTTPPAHREVVNSSIPVGVAVENIGEEGEEEMVSEFQVDDSTLMEPTPIMIAWQGGGKAVVLARAGDDDWNGRQPMDQEDPASNTWTATIYLLPGTHHIRFLVDEQWRVSDSLPTAVDDQGSLANYVTVQPGTPPSQSSPVPPPTPTPTQLQSQSISTSTKPLIPGQSFWSTTSSLEDDTPHPSLSSHPQPKWTSTLPPALLEAAREEESYLTASAGHYDPQSRSTHVTGFVPAPNIPPAPGMPRHLDKLILNTKMTQPGSNNSAGNGGGSGAGSPARGSGMAGGVGSGQGGGRDRDRDRERGDKGKREGRRSRKDGVREEREKVKQRKEREREAQLQQREREQQQATTKDSSSSRRDSSPYANFPPAPPPSEDGTGAGLDEKPEQSPIRGDSGEAVETGNTSPGDPGVVGDTPTATPRQRESTNTTAVTAPEQPAINSPDPAVPSKTTTTSNPPPPVVSVTHPPGTANTTLPPGGGVSGSRAITLDTESLPALTDDGSVLPVPSHVVLQHLCTSAIRNGVLAVADTTRYRGKYMTTVYYKPTS